MATSTTLLASSKFIYSACLAENKGFLQCKQDNADPSKCLTEGSAVTSCVLKL
jgi:hypothetical protein